MGNRKTSDLILTAEKVLLVVVSAALCLMIADYAVRMINKIHFRRNFESRIQSEKNQHADAMKFLRNRFLLVAKSQVIRDRTPLVVFVGDSITLGSKVNRTEHTFVDVFDLDTDVAAQGSDHPLAMNMSGPGANIMDEAMVLKDVLSRFHPNVKLVVQDYCLNDIFFSVDESHRGIIAALLMRFEQRKKYRNGVSYYGMHEIAYGARENQRMVQSAFSNIHDTAERHGAKALTVIFPYFTDFGEKPYSYLSVHKMIAAWARRAQIEVLDLYPYYKRYGYAPFLSRGDTVHPNALGHKLAADAIYGFVAAKKLAPVPPMSHVPGLHRETSVDRAGYFCDAIFEGESQNERGYCPKILADLIRRGKILSRTNPRDSYFFIDF